MRFFLTKSVAVMLLISSVAYAQTPQPQWKRSVVKLEAILQRYNDKQVKELLQKQLAELGKTISQHETFERRDALAGLKDTVQGMGVLLSDGPKLYIVTNKHLIKATEPLGVTHREVITDFLTAHLDIPGRKTNYINLLNFISITPESSPVVFSDDKTDLAIISLQQKSKKMIVDYIMQNGGVGLDIGSFQEAVPKHSLFAAVAENIPLMANCWSIPTLLRKMQVNERHPAFNKTY